MRLHSIAAVLSLGLALAGCDALDPPSSPGPTASLPADAVLGAGDPVRSAVTFASNAFSNPNRLAGQPAVAARAVASMEYLAVDLPNDPRFSGTFATLEPQLEDARREWRGVLGIAPGAPPQTVIDSLFGASRALGAGQSGAAALPPSVFTRGGQATLATLADMPRLPITNAAAVNATDLLRQYQGMGRGRF